MRNNNPMLCMNPAMAVLAAGFALDALDERERQVFIEHLATCQACQDEVDVGREVGAQLGYLAPPNPPAPALRARILAQAQVLRPANDALSHDDFVNEPSHSHAPRTITKRSKKAFDAKLWQVTTSVAAAVLLILLPWNLSWHQQLVSQQGQLNQLSQMQTQLADILASPNVQAYVLYGTLSPSASGHVYVDADHHRLVIVAANLPDVGTDKTYQVWLNHDGVRTNVGIFRPTNGGEAILLGQLPQKWSFYQSLGVTVEPAGGSLAPTGPNIMLTNGT